MTTCEPLMDCDTEMQLGFSLPEFHASQRVEPGSNEAATMTAGSGRKLSESFPLSGPLGRCSRILLESETWASPEFYLTWKIKATKCGCSVFQLAPSVPRTEGNATGSCVTEPLASSWTTPTSDGGGRMKPYAQGGHPLPYQLTTATWPTPDASEAGKTSRGGNRQDEPLIGGLVRTLPASAWPTPQERDGTPRGPMTIAQRKGHVQTLDNYLNDTGLTPSTCLAQTASFVVRLMTLSMWLMGYTAAYLAHWAIASSRKLPKGSSPP
jgi:hypothetical protein